MNADDVNIEASWKKVLRPEFEDPYFDGIKAHLVKRKKAGAIIYPPGNLIFNAFDSTPFDDVKVVILGQDPYFRKGQAMGLCFSVPRGVRVPPSLRRIYAELAKDVGIKVPSHGDLSFWAAQGVFLLNAILTVEEGKPASHAKIGWERFTDAVIKTISDYKEGVCFLLWGNFARGKKSFIDDKKHYILESPHPSPMTGNAFFGHHHFSKVNQILTGQGKHPIDWEIPD